jgi:molybdate transport system substrate-binding protein
MQRILLFVLLCLAVPARAAEAPKLMVFAASSLTEVMNVLGDTYAKTGQPRPVFSFAASSALARQIENGAPAGVFASADEEWMDYLAARKLIAPDTRSTFVGNSLVLITPADRPLDIKIAPHFALAPALKGGKLSLADPTNVPAGKYAKAAFEKLSVWDALQPSIINADNVRGAMAFVERGEAAAGVVYATDAALSKKVTVVGTFPSDSYAPISYPLAVVAANDTPSARAFRDFLLGDAAKAIYRRFGFAVE